MRAILTIAIPGAGKSTYARKLEQQNPKIKRATKDQLRFILWDTNRYSEKFEENVERFGDLLDNMYLDVIDTILAQGLDVIIDEINHTKRMRLQMRNFLKGLYPDIKLEAHYIRCPLDVCLKRNKQRNAEQIVPDEVIRMFHQELVASFGGTDSDVWQIAEILTKEGFDKIEFV